MTILVDEIKEYPNCKLKFKRWSHLVSDSSFEELHEFAQKIGLKREWFQGNHYDLVPTRRKLAIANGAIEVTSRELVKRMHGRKTK